MSDAAQARARSLYEGLLREGSVRILDVRNAEEFARWRIEGRGPVETLNLPYFEFIEAESDSVARVRRWLDGGSGRLVVVCAKGGSSEFVADVLRGHGIEAQNLDGGMTAWGQETVVRPVVERPVRVWQVQRFGKGCLSYVAAVGQDAIAVDPHRDADDYGQFLDENGLKLRAVFDTHLHADHISGAPALAAATGADHYASPEDFRGAAFSFLPVKDGDRVRFGGVTVTPLFFLEAPGHTPGSTMLRIGDELVLTGDTLFVSGVGRPDLAGKAVEWGRELHRTLHTRMTPLVDDVLVLPAHSAGASEARPDGVVGERLGTLRRVSPAMRAGVEEFLAEVEGAVRPAPEAYAMIREINLGTRDADESSRTEMELGKNECALSKETKR